MGVLDGYDSNRAAPVNNGGFTKSSSMGGNQSIYEDPFLRPGFRPDDARPDFENLPPEEPIVPDVLPDKPKPENDSSIGSGGLVTVDAIAEQQDLEDSNNQSAGLTDDQRFMLIGLVVLGGILGFIKR